MDDVLPEDVVPRTPSPLKRLPITGPLFRKMATVVAKDHSLLPSPPGPKPATVVVKPMARRKAVKKPVQKATTKKEISETVICKKCDLEVPSGDLQYLKIHVMLHAVTKVFRCTLCEFGSNAQSNWSKHFQNRHGEQATLVKQRKAKKKRLHGSKQS